ncbi:MULTISPECIES: hypothetical protein [Chryseobacterium]|uniref:hypothetical protein n=1 Tax=Chryseobacterium TaxID=59732 RepID=UPI000410BE79|nr:MULTISPECIES: hypothetical protein [Chryseobacterium]AZA53819.1 hypothetical protein EG348_12790 [Chryseobacterium sp. G0201]
MEYLIDNVKNLYIVLLFTVIVLVVLDIIFEKRKNRKLERELEIYKLEYQKLEKHFSEFKDNVLKNIEDASCSYIIKNVEKRGNELINRLNLLNAKLVKIQEHHKNLQERQQKLHDSLLDEHKLLNQYFENYS